MSRKTTITLSVVIFVALAALIICEKKWPTAGTELISRIFSK